MITDESQNLYSDLASFTVSAICLVLSKIHKNSFPNKQSTCFRIFPQVIVSHNFFYIAENEEVAFTKSNQNVFFTNQRILRLKAPN